MRPFLTDDQIAARLRAVEAKLRARSLGELATEIAELALILESEAQAA